MKVRTQLKAGGRRFNHNEVRLAIDGHDHGATGFVNLACDLGECVGRSRKGCIKCGASLLSYWSWSQPS